MQEWEMRVNASKCGVMEIGVNRTAETRSSRLERTSSRWSRRMHTSAATSPMTLTSGQWQTSRQMGAASLAELRPFIANGTIPIWVRRHTLTSIILPRMLYGAELWGMNGGRSEPAQRVADKATRLLLSIGEKGAGLSLNAMREELGIGKVEAMAAARRARAIIKFSSLKTWIAELVKNPLSAQKATWVSGTTRWLNRYTSVPSLQRSREEDPTGQSIQRRVYRS